MLGLRLPWQRHRSSAEGRARWQLHLIFALKLLASFGYFILSLTLPLYLTDEHGFDDKSAGVVYGVVGMLISLYSFPSGFVIDRVGVQNTVLASAALTIVAGLALATLDSTHLVLMVLCSAMPASHALDTPALATAVGILSEQAARAVAPPETASTTKAAVTEQVQVAVRAAYGIFYTMMNAGKR
jgi:dipeptide/tripeptide permease